MELGSDGVLGGMGVLPPGRVSLSLKSPQTPEEGVLPEGTRSRGAGWWGGGVGICPDKTFSLQGSTCAFTERILRSYGLKTGFFRY